MSQVVSFTNVPPRALRLAGLGVLAAGAAWNLAPVHPPLLCPLRTLTGIPCPFCGLTRAVVAAMHGDVLGSLAFNPAGLFVVALAAFVLVTGVLPWTRAPAAIVAGAFAVLWVYNVTLNPTF